MERLRRPAELALVRRTRVTPALRVLLAFGIRDVLSMLDRSRARHSATTPEGDHNGSETKNDGDVRRMLGPAAHNAVSEPEHSEQRTVTRRCEEPICSYQ
jgi:hypothetical protein